jgi:FkbM family methyltransferase
MIHAMPGNRRLRRLATPEYLYRPTQILRRLRATRQVGDEVLVRLPWGLTLAASQGEAVGSGIVRTGVHELAVTEAMWRLADPTDVAADVGANIGYFTSLLATRCRRVVAFEPHPLVRRRLAANVARWGAAADRVVVDARAVSRAAGWATLVEPPDFLRRQGSATLVTATPDDGLHVTTASLDESVADEQVTLLKVDVEGHELAVLEGAGAVLSTVRDVFFEEHEPLPTPTTDVLEAAGFTLFGLVQHLRGVRLTTASDPRSRPAWEAPTYLATRDPGRALHRTRPGGWRSLKRR